MYLYFEVYNDQSGPTGNALYEGLDTRNKCIMSLCTWSGGKRGVSLTGSDRIRSYLQDFFETDEEK
jgi:hypothetical protein